MRTAEQRETRIDWTYYRDAGMAIEEGGLGLPGAGIFRLCARFEIRSFGNEPAHLRSFVNWQQVPNSWVFGAENP
jgi:hypothetical protein